MATRYNLIMTVQPPAAINNGMAYEVQDIHTVFPTEQDAATAGAAKVAANPEYYLSFRVFAYTDQPIGQWAPPPMSGPENDDAWIDGPGSPAL